MPKTIVIAVDAEERTQDALALGRLLAEVTGARPILVTVFAHPPLADPASPELALLRDEARGTLLELAEAIGLDDADAEVVSGTFAARALQHVSERPDTGLIVVGSTTRGAIGRLLVGGVGERLLAGAACPVALAPRGYGEGAPARLGHIGVGVDDSGEAQHALAAAVALARASGARLHVVTAWHPLAFGVIATSSLPATSANDAMRIELEAVHDRAVAWARERVEAEGRFRDGAPGEVLVEESRDVDLLLTGSRGYGPHGAVLVGSASAALAHGAHCPVVVLPRGTSFGLLDS